MPTTGLVVNGMDRYVALYSLLTTIPTAGGVH